jgi:aryl-alcohol dehydrogenase-like predicted oxidoreductase
MPSSCIDLYYQHRIDPATPIEETMGCLKELVAEGKIKYIGLSECTAAQLQQAHAVYPISAIEMEWSLNARDIESSVLPVARELGVGIVAYSPLGRGLLTGTITSLDSLSQSDWRRNNPRFKDGNLEKNVATNFFDIAARKGCTPAQIALAWVLSRGDDVVPIPGTKSLARLTENIGAVKISLSPEEWKEVEASIPEIQGARY